MAPKRHMITLSALSTRLVVSGVPMSAFQKVKDTLLVDYGFSHWQRDPLGSTITPSPVPKVATASFAELEAKILEILGPSIEAYCMSEGGQDSFSFDGINVQPGGA